jgi:hypothetical protein
MFKYTGLAQVLKLRAEQNILKDLETMPFSQRRSLGNRKDTLKGISGIDQTPPIPASRLKF